METNQGMIHKVNKERHEENQKIKKETNIHNTERQRNTETQNRNATIQDTTTKNT